MSPGYSPAGAARRQALAERRRARQDGPAPPPGDGLLGGRLHGHCELCGEIHRSPDMRYRCTGCGLEVCLAHAQELAHECPDCGGRLELGPEILGAAE